MSADDGERATREVAYRVFAAEYDDATHTYRESEEERAPNYVVTPGGARLNRVFVVGVLTAVERVGDDDVLRARVADPTGAFVVYAGQYQPEARATIDELEPPAFVAVTGKANTFTPEDGDRTYVSIRPESVATVDAATRDRWVVSTAEATLDRVAVFADALAREERDGPLAAALAADGVPTYVAEGIPQAIAAYDTGRAYLGALRELALAATRGVAGDADEVAPLETEPDAPGGTDQPLQVVPGAEPFAGRAAAGEAQPSTEAEAAADSGDTAGAEAPPTDEAGVREQTTEAAEAAGSVGEHPGTETGAGAPAADEPAGEPGETAETTADEPGDTGTATADGPGTGGPDTDAAGDDGGGGAATGDADAGAGGTGDPGDPDEMYELDESEREAVTEEYGVEFSSGSEIPDAGEADIETPDADPDPQGEPTPDATAADAGGPPDEPADEPGGSTAGPPEDAGAATETEDEADGPVDLEDAVVEHMRDLGGGDGVARTALVEAVAETHGVDPEAVEDAVQEALMSGRCYESGEDELTPI